MNIHQALIRCISLHLAGSVSCPWVQMGWSPLSVGGPIRFPIRKIILAGHILELKHLSTNRFRTFLEGKEKKATKERFFLVTGVKLYATHVKHFPLDLGKGQVSATIRKDRMKPVKTMMMK